MVSSIGMVNHKNTRHQIVRYLNIFRIQMFGIWNVTEYSIFKYMLQVRYQ